ncbi:unnamed protein product [Clonostachys rosea]|uniref:Uncharacterized protein n=1 Tax=Bionectria ochroleuca TaxID=29856 RepID=A0ABY6URP8_BIOOC|nr:unnamed protein product [Clonostachys rosea]
MRSQAALALSASASSTDLVLRGTILEESQVFAVFNAWAGTRKFSGSRLSSSEVHAESDGMSRFEVMKAARDIQSALVKLERECIWVTQTLGELTGSDHDPSKPRLKAISSERDRLLVKLHDQLLDSPHPAARSALKKMAAKYDMARMRIRAKRYNQIIVPETVEPEISEEAFDEQFQNLDEIVKTIFEVWERLNKYVGKTSEEPVYPAILDELCLEFPHAVRHLCTTMPWTIWPSLVVLWGVCWMFKPFVTQHMIYSRPGITSLVGPELDLHTSQSDHQTIFDLQDPYLLDFDSDPSWLEIDGLGSSYEPPKIDNLVSHSNDMDTLGTEMRDHIAPSDASLLQDSSHNHAKDHHQDETTSSENHSSGEGGSSDPLASDMYETTPSHLASDTRRSNMRVVRIDSLVPIRPAKDPTPGMLSSEKLI